jgi:hypothetical protein
MKVYGLLLGLICLPGYLGAQESPLLQRWLTNPPNLWEDIENSPSFATKARIAISGRDNDLGFDLGVEDVFWGDSKLTVSGGYQQEFNGNNQTYYSNLRYYVLPLGSYVNFAPQLGYRRVFNRTGVDLGVHLVLALSPQSADIRLEQVFTDPGSDTEVGITTLSTSYALDRQLFFHSAIQWRRSSDRSDRVVRLGLEWKLGQ